MQSYPVAKDNYVQSSTNLSEVVMVLASHFVFIINNIVNLAKLIRKTDTIINRNNPHYVAVGRHCCSRLFCTVCHLFGILKM